MTINYEPSHDSVERRVSENILSLLFRMGWQRKDLAEAAHMNAGTLGRKLKNLSPWHVGELENIAKLLHVSVVELVTDLPDYEAWCAIKGSNLGPTDMEHGPVVYLADYRTEVVA